jgi:NADH dehydrogenase
MKFSGLFAWLLWSVVHIYFLIGFRRRAIVAMHWAWNYVTFQRGTRLITGITGSRIEDVMPLQPTPSSSAQSEGGASGNSTAPHPQKLRDIA